jgi:hypothetical protein
MYAGELDASEVALLARHVIEKAIDKRDFVSLRRGQSHLCPAG